MEKGKEREGKESKLAVALAADPSPNHAAGRVRVVCGVWSVRESVVSLNLTTLQLNACVRVLCKCRPN